MVKAEIVEIIKTIRILMEYCHLSKNQKSNLKKNIKLLVEIVNVLDEEEDW